MTSGPITGELFLGRDREQGTGERLNVRAPATDEPLEPSFALAGLDDVRTAAALAARDFDEYRAVAPDVRAGFLDGIAAALDADGDAIVDRASRESGLTVARLTGELARTTGQLRFFADLVRGGETTRWAGESESTILSRPVPLGPVAVFGASNFPLAFSNAGGDTAAALAAGCPVVVKSHEAHPGTAELVSRAVVATAIAHGMPAGVYSALLATDHAVGRALVTDPRIAAVAFTGSRAAGLALLDAAQSRPVPIPVYAEMSSINPVVVLSSAATRETARGYVASLTLGSGQFCTSPGVLFLPVGADGDRFTAVVAESLEAVTGQTMLTPGIRSAFEEGRARLAAIASEIGRGVDGTAGLAPAPAVYQVDLESFVSDPSLSHEIFGAASLIVRYTTVDALLSAVAGLEGQLTATIHTDGDDAGDLARVLAALELRAGRIVFNGWPTGVEVVHEQVHGGPFPATTDARTTSVGGRAYERFQRRVAYQNLPADLVRREAPTAATIPA